ncbi:MAG: hypothetical protein ACXVPU_19805, partial [Bacteroidia bacterium]
MADNTDEKHLDNPTNMQSENTDDEIIPIGGAEAIKTNQETENMEVHHHHAHHGEKKNWKSYIWEFVMLFLAVFCGFLAEYKLEHVIEHQQAKVYATNLYQELKKDTSGINNIIQDIKVTTGKLDSLCLLGTEKTKHNITNGMLYYYASYATSINLYSSDNTTIEQLKGSGNLRIMGNNISQMINVYGKKLNSLETEYGLTRPEFAKIEELYFRIFDGYAIQVLSKEGSGQARDSVNGNPLIRDSVFKLNTPLINKDPAIIKYFFITANY